MMRLSTLAAEVTARAVVRAVRAARGITVGTDHWPAACDLPATASRPRMNHRRDPAAMPESLRLRLLSLRDLLVSAGPLVLLMLLLLALAYWWLDPNPPRRVTLATGPAQSAYAEFGQRYRKALAAQGIEVVLLSQRRFVGQPATAAARAVPTSASCRVAARARATPTATPHRVAGQPVPGAGVAVLPQQTRRSGPPAPTRWAALAQLQGLRVNVGTAGSGVPHLMNALFELNRLDAGTMRCRSWTRPRPPSHSWAQRSMHWCLPRHRNP
jgi:hypothetical protein